MMYNIIILSLQSYNSSYLYLILPLALSTLHQTPSNPHLLYLSPYSLQFLVDLQRTTSFLTLLPPPLQPIEGHRTSLPPLTIMFSIKSSSLFNLTLCEKPRPLNIVVINGLLTSITQATYHHKFSALITQVNRESEMMEDLELHYLEDYPLQEKKTQ
uniref:Uncharacterized protein n=1 Tax=Lactuca sativa TaxID=4236 RepID=A0A9R1V8B9_LACSA|nr:hypothetical protein LSAT_V11C600307420 [Lactuca sativa]